LTQAKFEYIIQEYKTKNYLFAGSNMKIKTILKIVATAVVVVPLIGVAAYYAMNSENIPFESICDPGNDKYTPLCKNIGKRAHTKRSLQGFQNTDFGEIIGVAWRARGSKISAPGQDIRTSESNSYYYIIRGDKKGFYFLRIVSEITEQ
jgi:hypothetical protein